MSTVRQIILIGGYGARQGTRIMCDVPGKWTWDTAYPTSEWKFEYSICSSQRRRKSSLTRKATIEKCQPDFGMEK